MARQLKIRLDELELERERLQATVQRVGESVGTGIDRDAQLDIVVQTAVDGVGAERRPRGAAPRRATARWRRPRARATSAAPSAAMHGGRGRGPRAGEPAEITAGGADALGPPAAGARPARHRRRDLDRAPGRPRSPRPSTTSSRYLASQAALSIENVGLHETIQRQAVTDELTGLFNHRRFQEVMATRWSASGASSSELGLIMLDIDDFKHVNDTYGHLQGDQVLREVARVLRETSREVDEPARYGGEEMAVALPQTGLRGRVRVRRARARAGSRRCASRCSRAAASLHVTASFGVAALPDSAPPDKDALVAAADAALYRAKRSGKNRTMKAG